MNNSTTFLIVGQACDEAIAWFIRQVNGAGLKVIRTFDLQEARHVPADCPCPHHGTQRCSCQMVVLLVYGDDSQPVSLVTHSYGGQTRFSIVDNPQQRADPYLERAIRQAFSMDNIPPLGQTYWSQASEEI